MRELFTRYAAGDVAGVRQLFAGRALDAGQARRIETRCMRIVDLAVNVISLDDTTSIIETSETLFLDGLRIERAHSRFVLKRDRERWLIASWESREAALASRVADAPPEERAGILDESEALQTETLVRQLARRGVERVNANRVTDAAQLIELASVIAERLGDPAALADVMSARSIVARYRAGRDLDLAADLVRESVAFAEASGDADALAVSLLRHARLREELDGVRDPAPLERAMALADRVANTAVLSHIATHIFRAYEASARPRDAFRYADLASRYAEASGDTAARISASIVLSGAYLWFGDERLAMPHVRRAAQLSVAAGFDNGAALSFGTMANALLARGDLDGAKRVLDDALETITAPSAVAMLLRARAGVNIHLRDFDAAEADITRSAAVHPVDGSNRNEVEDTFAVVRFHQGRFDEAKDHAERVGDIRLLARTLRCMGRDDEALALLDGPIVAGSSEEVTILEPQRMIFAARTGVDRELLMTMLVERGRIAEAFTIAENMKAVALRYAVSARAGEALPTPTARERELEWRVAGLNRALLTEQSAERIVPLRQQLGDARTELLDFRQRAYVSTPGPQAPRPLPFDVDELPARLDDVAIVSYVVTDENTTIFVHGPKLSGGRTLSVHVSPIGGWLLHRKVVRFADAVDQRNLRTDVLGAELYELLVRPFEAQLRATRRLCIIPHGELWRVPFQALGPDGGPYLADRVALFYAPSVALLAATESKRRHREPGQHPALLAFANPRMSDQAVSLYRAFDRDVPLGNLAEAETEVRAIARLYGRERSTIRVGDAARETTLKREAPRYDILHIATHGLVHEQAPMFSSLVLSPSPGERDDDGLLEAREIAQLDLGADLAVLSACDTGKSGGGGVIGLSWALLAAGCPTTIVSQWRAHSAATATMMVDLHRHLVAGASKPEALRRAQLALRKDPRYRHPFYWAAFIVVGAP